MGTVGFIGGKYIPLHQGHVYAITKSACMVDKLYVVLTYSKKRDYNLCNKSKMKYIPYQIRLRWLSQLTQNMENVEIIGIEDSAESDERYNWEEGAEKIKKAIHSKIDYIFSSEHNYTKIFNNLYPDSKHIIIDDERKVFSISATDIRRDGVYKYWDYIPLVVKSSFVKKIVIVGTESCGKSTLTRYLAKLYNTTYIAEYGRDFYEQMGGYEGGFTDDLYKVIAYGHKMKEFEAVQNANKIVFIDTEAVTTHYYSQLYNDNINPLLDEIAKSQEYDLILYLEPDVKWIDDGSRKHGDEDIRLKNNVRLKELFKKNKLEFQVIKGDYTQRLEKAIQLVNRLL